MKKSIFILLIFSFSIYLSGCLAVETKEYSFKLKKDKSGQGTVKFINIMSVIEKQDSVSSADKDFRELIDIYLNGDKLKDDFPGAKNFKKRIFEEDNQLCGELTFDFDDISKMKFYRYKDSGPMCYYLGLSQMGLMGGNETYFSSNGTYGGETMPVIFWDGADREFKFKTTLTQPNKDSQSLIELWNKNNDK